ncbi:23262_t:CDS:2 [Dentiscutata erythropus]|uniref:23262_t:CDS:1 n=1 Tax=Dentiscutata erythropus TaxID=1348616 RepID=A0A9N9GRB5_9GLOM|nr:23262_t:CDS:2 [Dentiscutata erythropus]
MTVSDMNHAKITVVTNDNITASNITLAFSPSFDSLLAALYPIEVTYSFTNVIEIGCNKYMLNEIFPQKRKKLQENAFTKEPFREIRAKKISIPSSKPPNFLSKIISLVRGTPGGTAGAICNSTDDCNGGLTCTRKSCLPPSCSPNCGPDDPCSSDDDCKSPTTISHPNMIKRKNRVYL